MSEANFSKKVFKAGEKLNVISIVLIVFLIGISGYLYTFNLSLQARINDLTIENDELKSEIYYLQSQITELQNEYISLKADYDLLNDKYSLLNSEYIKLQEDYSFLNNQYQTLKTEYDQLKFEYDIIFKDAPSEYVAVSVVYYTKFGEEKHIMTFFIPYDLYEYYDEKPHPPISKYNLEVARQYITPNERIIQNIVSKIKMQTSSEEELANALLDFVQDKKYVLSVRYYPTLEYKYPIETLVEMGGDCDTHAFLYATLLKAAGFKVLLVFSSDMTHAAVAVHLKTSPENNTQESAWYFTLNGLKYYFAETTGWGWRVGDLPEDLQDKKFYLIEV